MNDVLSTTISDFLKKVANINIENYLINVHHPNKKGDGYMGEMCFVSLKNKSSGGDSYDFVIKQAFTDDKIRDIHPVRRYFLNEIHFYNKVRPGLEKIQNKMSLTQKFDKIPRCFGTSSELKQEKLLLENLKVENFKTYERTRPFDEEHLKFIMKQFGKFHAISFAYKSMYPQEYQEVTEDLDDHFVEVMKQPSFSEYLKYISDISLKSLDKQRDAKAIEKLQPYLGNMAEIFCDRSDYRGVYSVVLHGDCGSHNLMFQYNKSFQLEDIRLIDFQRSKIGTPVFDLSNCLYTGVSKEALDQLDYYLGVYHGSLSKSLEEFGLSSEDIYPFEYLKKDWKEYCQTGFIMGLLMWRFKLTYEDNVADLTDMEGDEMATFEATKYDVDTFNSRSRHLILHMFENDFL